MTLYCIGQQDTWIVLVSKIPVLYWSARYLNCIGQQDTWIVLVSKTPEFYWSARHLNCIGQQDTWILLVSKIPELYWSARHLNKWREERITLMSQKKKLERKIFEEFCLYKTEMKLKMKNKTTNWMMCCSRVSNCYISVLVHRAIYRFAERHSITWPITLSPTAPKIHCGICVFTF